MKDLLDAHIIFRGTLCFGIFRNNHENFPLSLMTFLKQLSQLSDDVIPLMNKQDNQFQLQLAPDVDPQETIVVDPLKLRQILLNLLSNAAKFTQRGTIQLHIADPLTEGVRWLSIRVQDNGMA